MAFQMALLIGGGAWVGTCLDEHYQFERPIWAAALSLVGVFMALYLLIRQAKRLSKEDEQ